MYFCLHHLPVSEERGDGECAGSKELSLCVSFFFIYPICSKSRIKKGETEGKNVTVYCVFICADVTKVSMLHNHDFIATE
jgi:hypothetical protein